ncbi:MAG: UDP-N-acetylglucosamine--N-acetylmuramyl-(pentapeptide) pyrophosphoryl-undecaprenol N-acetylglucosamine transferase, partial [Bdellovibrionales bacterium]|nr:UDP-N-acetylglucosamine--N-acetylmuramyl-(pentapeptide) pyrophosphoryl-undecaprenol N-acetylglucosamine transferase [Bdellovibrionales bacterium]NQZ19924.1 UDP-N-acetylglucosamine--N-acetylmuramyl-(pentapeptide) pyrophosphoryl-undecaprenol N-acetylglucosamine transferase [Bdellovibrionales bacterium]
MKKTNVVIAGGGTGGHIYPGLALAEKLKSSHPNIQVHFVGAKGGLEEKIIPRHGYPLHLFKIDRMHHSVGLLRRLKTLFLLPFCFIHAAFLYFKLKPAWVLGVGGFASGPFVFTSAILGGRTAVLEPNAFPGLANRWLSKVVNFCFVVFSESKNYFPKKKVKAVGLPVRIQKNHSPSHYEKGRPLRLLVFGGSQGARAINEVVGDWVETLGFQGAEFEIVHQVGQRDFDNWKERYSNKHENFLKYSEYIHDMPDKLDWADLIVCRAGIGTVAEVAMVGKPAIFIPRPTAADNHQQKNAEVLVSRGAAAMVVQKDFNSD